MVGLFKKCAFLFLAMMMMAFYSCKPDPDQDLPVIGIPSWNLPEGAFFQNDTLFIEAGSDLNMSVDLSDDDALNQYRLNLAPLNASAFHPDQSNFVQQEIVSLNGTSASLNFQTNLSELLRGTWDFDLSLLDESGKQALPLTQLIEVVNTQLPTVRIDSISGNPSLQNISLSAGNTFNLYGELNSELNLDYLEVNFFQAGNNVGSSNYFLSATSMDLVEIGPISLPSDVLGALSMHLTFYNSSSLPLRCVFELTVVE
ncbi:MAG: hypothetical protein P8H98_08665 [Flavobacteriales bacterium]|nr:hypothetical protein [Flavobacteriales bacterium]